MSWKSLALVLAVFLSLFSVADAGEMQLGGFVKTDNRILTGSEDYSLVDMHNTLRLEFKTDLSESVSAFSSLDMRYHNFPTGSRFAALERRSQIDPLDLALWECYADLYSFLLPSLDLRIGKQRIAWGTADRLNPTDNLNPDDFSDPLDFGRVGEFVAESADCPSGRASEDLDLYHEDFLLDDGQGQAIIETRGARWPS